MKLILKGTELMKINIYYGGRGVVDDPTLFVLEKIQEVLYELNVTVERFNLYEQRNQITALSQTVTEADGIILATTVEWLGMGGYMQTFLDSCWLYADKTKISNIYMFPVVMSKTYGEREVSLSLTNSWEMLGGKNGSAITAYVDDTTEFEFNKKYIQIIEKKTEDMYRTISQKRTSLPSSSQTIKNNVMKDVVKFTPQESEQLSKYASDDAFVKTQKQDIESLASIYKEMLTEQEQGGDSYYINIFNDNFKKGAGFVGTYMIIISDKDKSIVMDVDNDRLDVRFGENKAADVIAKLNKDMFDEIVAGKVTFHRAFMTGDMTAKGNFRSLRMLDELFEFKK
jgi:multimeric flavodoxin WrbA